MIAVFKLLEMKSALSRDKRIIGLVIAALVAFVSLVATAVTAAVMLSQSVQNANFVNELAHNISMAKKNQEDIDLKLEVKLSALESVVVQIGNKVEALEKRMSLSCHAAYKGICVTNVIYNQPQWNWQRLLLQGIWHHNNSRLGLHNLHQEILDIQNAKDTIINPQALVKDLLDNLQGFNPFNMLRQFLVFDGDFVLTSCLFLYLSVSCQILQ